MQRSNKAGDQTRAAIYNTAKKLFYEKGFEATSYMDIKNELNINKGLIPYHFNTKYDLARLIYDEVEDKIDSTLTELFPDTDNGILALTAVYLFQKLTRTNANFARFCCELSSQPESFESNLKDQYRFMNLFFSGETDPREDAHLRTVAALCNGIDIAILRGAHLGFLTDTPEDVFRIDSMFLLKELSYSEEKGQALLDQVIQLPVSIKMKDSFELKIIRNS